MMLGRAIHVRKWPFKADPRRYVAIFGSGNKVAQVAVETKKDSGKASNFHEFKEIFIINDLFAYVR